MTRVYVGNLAHDTTEGQLQEAFSRFGQVSSVKIMRDRRGRPKGYATVQMADAGAAAAAIAALKGMQLNGRTMDLAEEERRPAGGGARGGRRRR